MRSCLCCLWLVLGHWYALWTHKHTCHGSYLQSEWRIRPGKQNRSTLTLSWEFYFSYRSTYLDMKFYHVFLYPYRLNTFSLTRRGLWPAMSCSSRSAPLPVSLMGTSCFLFSHILPSPFASSTLPHLSPSLNAECASQYIWRFSLLALLIISNCISASLNTNYTLKVFGRKGISPLQAFVHVEVTENCVQNIFVLTISWFKNIKVGFEYVYYPLDK